jgi:hypothetical protein
VRDFVGAELDHDFGVCGPGPARISIQRFEYAADGTPRDAAAPLAPGGRKAPDRVPD